MRRLQEAIDEAEVLERAERVEVVGDPSRIGGQEVAENVRVIGEA